ncbi:hypothetical protein F5Y00DRAFT_258152 [Daldinia vernicosa]|uniref:uncharacterized protein n=1 Tax=Daldinia vernicosa TaxID=114800 RepID=UPI002008D943|nr:uncharacterized protein F5Y00DRAFT_258152 [Daldinia vernicosa]KAI0852896.1 hypothetical protein F5Y00DRAFT_258152 [Daldinia vernicosa]
MAKRTAKVPNAWEDEDWEAQADKAITTEEESKSQPQPQPQLSKAERLAQHAESNKKLWESAEAPPEAFHYLAARSDPPLATGFKSAVKVLSRKPVSDPNAGDGDDDEDSKKAPQLTPEEILAKQQREREERQRRYDEARAKIFGTNSAAVGGSNPSSGTTTPGAVTPPRSAEGRGPRGKGRGGRGGGGGHRHNESRGERDRDRDSNIQRPSSQSGGGRELYDPNYSPKPGVQLERRGNSNNSDGGAPLSRRSTPREEDQVIRAPRGPDGSGRGGFGFAKRGAKGS